VIEEFLSVEAEFNSVVEEFLSVEAEFNSVVKEFSSMQAELNSWKEVSTQRRQTATKYTVRRG
jgi:hypothetical protein